ncbi:hypothetical protein F5B22DRAFT_657977 [Xylaria bambusicola]|uniref:uncharacterized protein n=1 Tax=Xylaria bambusicola TaxID=326684 RepID=UPI002007961B|nr:uncharacterized protein F5B22DRAFT_657977 [Xylaria bambusicola]KAI0509580.1 hypothetical protein F5B22DRAFT_657977 [Xylaria bambusicola]
MADPRSRHSGRRSPVFNPARASMPVNIGYNLPYTGELHATPTTRYDPPAPRRHEPKPATGPAPPSATVTTTYNVTKEPVSRSLSRSNRHRSSTADSHSGKPIIVTTNHPRSHAPTSHASGSVRTGSPAREAYRTNDDAYYAVQPASSIRSRSHNRHSYHQGAPLGDEFYRLRERVAGTSGTGAAVGDDRFWGPVRTSTDNFRNPRPHLLYTTPAHPAHHATPVYPSGSAAPSELVRYDLDHDRDRRTRRDSAERPYYRPHVNVVSHDASRYEPRPRAKPPASSGLERYNRAAAAGAYDRPSVTMPAPPAVPPPPPIDTSRRPALLEAPRSPSSENRTTRPRPVSLYQDGPTRPIHTDDIYRSRDDERVGKDRRERDDGYRDDNVTARGFGIRTDTLDRTHPVQAYDERRPRHEIADRELKRLPDEPPAHLRPHDRDAADDYRSRTEESRDRREDRHRRDGVGRRESVSRTRDKITAGLKGAAAANVSPRRRTSDEGRDYDSRANEASRPKETEPTERKPSPRADTVTYEQRREPRRERAESVSGSKDREVIANIDRDPERESPRNRDHGYEKEREGERSRVDERDQRDRPRHSGDARPNGSSDKREASPDDVSNTGRRRQRPVSAFDPTDTKGLIDLKAELAAMDGQSNGTKKADEPNAPSSVETISARAATGTNSSDKGDESDSRGREVVPMRDEKQVRVVSPPRDKTEAKPIKGILKTPSAKFPEDSNPIREGVAPHKDDKTKKDVPAGARWTKISRKKVNPEALTIGKERFEVRDDFVIVLRVLNKEEIQAYATATAQIREMRRKEFERESRQERHSDEEQTRSDEERQRRHRHRQEKEEEEYRRGRAADDKHRRHKYDDDSETRPKTIEYHSGQPQHHHRHYESSAEDRR